MDQLGLEEVLELTYLQSWSWSSEGNFIGAVIDDGGCSDLWVFAVESGQSWNVSQAQGGVGNFCWHPSEPTVAYVVDGNLATASSESGEWETDVLTKTAQNEISVTYSPDGENLAFIREGSIWVLELATGRVRSLAPAGVEIFPSTYSGESVIGWSLEGDKLFFHFNDSESKLVQLGVTSVEGGLLWRTTWNRGEVGGIAWLDDERLLYTRAKKRNMVREFCVVTLPEDAAEKQKEVAEENRTTAPSTIAADEEVVYRQEAKGTPGPVRVFGAWPEPEGDRILFISEDDGWAHLYVYDPHEADLKQMTAGKWEDFGHMGDKPSWSPQGRYVCYSSNRGSAGERQLWLLDVDEESTHQLTSFPGTNVQPKWSPSGSDIAFVHCDPQRSADVWLLEIDEELKNGEAAHRSEARHLTHTMPSSWPSEGCVVPEEVSFKGADDWDIRGYLLAPPGSEEAPESGYPALVWVHGGPIRQMRYGFHPSGGYAFFYAVSQYLAHQGYATLMVNFRGGIGRGREFRNGLYRNMGVADAEDVVAGAEYLKQLSYVDEERVGVWGISYGGYMTLATLTKHPEVFRMGVNIAGIWDFAQWNDWITEKHGRQFGNFEIFFDGSPAESPELYKIGSPCTYAENLQKPLINIHGTADGSVDFAQMDRIVQDCVKLGKEYEAYYYPNEAHLFQQKSTWADALKKIERELARHLKK